MTKTLPERLSSLKSLIETQKDCIDGSGYAVDYMHGMANGMILAHAIVEDETPKFVSRRPRPYARIVRHKSAKNRKKK